MNDQKAEVPFTRAYAKKCKTAIEDSATSKLSQIDTKKTVDEGTAHPRKVDLDGKRKGTIKLPAEEIRYDRTEHLPGICHNKSQNRCRLEGCSLKTNHFCLKCGVYLCIKEKKNCFVVFHTKQSKQDNKTEI